MLETALYRPSSDHNAHPKAWLVLQPKLDSVKLQLPVCGIHTSHDKQHWWGQHYTTSNTTGSVIAACNVGNYPIQIIFWPQPSHPGHSNMTNLQPKIKSVNVPYTARCIAHLVLRWTQWMTYTIHNIKDHRNGQGQEQPWKLPYTDPVWPQHPLKAPTQSTTQSTTGFY